MTQVRHPQDTFSSTVRIVLPNDTNTLGNLMGEFAPLDGRGSSGEVPIDTAAGWW